MVSTNIEPGIYRHFKGNLYEVIGVARKVDSADRLVIYRPLYGDMLLVARPFEEFMGIVPGESGDEPRFRFVEQPNVSCRCHTPDQDSKSF